MTAKKAGPAAPAAAARPAMAKTLPGDERVVPIGAVKPWKDNPRIIKKADFDRLKRQILELGVYKRLLVAPDPEAFGYDFQDPVPTAGEAPVFVVIGGNMRLRALEEIGAPEVAITVVRPRDEAQLIEFSLSDNDNAGENDTQAVAELIYRNRDRIEISTYKIAIGRPADLESVLTAYGPDFQASEEDDSIPDLEPESDVVLGDIFELGRHRLICGDSTAPEFYKALLEGAKADMIFTDPPYNVDYHGEKHGGIMNDAMSADAFIDFSEAFMARFAESTKEGGVFYICSGYSSYPPFLFALKKAGMTFSGPIIWVKDNASMGWQDYKKKHEMILKAKKEKRRATPILYGWNGGRHYFLEDRFEADVWEIKRRAGATMLHPTQKPMALVCRAIRNSSRSGEIILDPFGGSGTTLIAADKEGRTARLIEMDPKYVDVIIRRYAAHVGQPEGEIRASRRRIPASTNG